jgi:hypothetical protein
LTRRALLIGAQTAGLQGVGNDLETMAKELSCWDFQIRPLDGKDASRDGIIAAYRRLITDTADGDAALVYFSMHGGIAQQSPPAAASDELPERYQFIVPFDFEESVDGDFRGITALELSALQDELTRRTNNVTVILDCCFAGRMSRDPGMVPKALLRVQFADITAHLQRIDSRRLTAGLSAPAGNRAAVRLVAAGPDQSAFEYTVDGTGSADGTQRRAGVFTEALCRALTQARGLPISWSTFMDDLRRRVQTISPYQRPEAEGPSHRLLFSTDVAAAGAVAVLFDGERVSLAGGRLSDIDVGDRFSVMPPGSSAVSAEQQIAVVTVSAVTPSRSEVQLESGAVRASVPPGVVAFPLSRAERRYPVAVTGDGPGADAVRKALRTASHVREIQAGDADPLVTVHISNNAVTLRDGAGDLTEPEVIAVGDVVAGLNRFARAAALRLIKSGTGGEALADSHDVQVQTKDTGGQWTPLAESEVTTVFVGQRVRVRLRNQSRGRLYFFVFDVGVSGNVTLLGDPSGLAVDGGEEYVVGRDDQPQLDGLPLQWPAGVPENGPRAESILVIVTSQHQDLGGLQQAGFWVPRGGQRSALEQLVDQFSAGTTRDLSLPPSAFVRYAVHHYDLQLQPAPRPAEELASFVIDERPDLSSRLVSRSGGVRPPRELAVRLLELQVHRNRAWGKADLHLDTLVITGAKKGAPLIYASRTEMFPRVADGDLLSLEHLLIFHGPVRDYMDVAVWVTRSRANNLALSKMLDESLNSADTQQAFIALSTLAGAASQAAVAAAAIGATAKIVDVAYQLLSGAVGNSIGVYRNSLLAGERFGVGRHPASGVLRAQDFSLSYEIIDVDGGRVIAPAEAQQLGWSSGYPVLPPGTGTPQ